MAGPAPPLTDVAEAQNLVKSIALSHDHLSDEGYSGTDPANRQHVKQVWRNMVVSNSSAAKLAKNIYLGMLSHEWNEAEALPGPIARMTFTLHDGGVQAAHHKSIADELGELHPSMTLFLKNIGRIELDYFDRTGSKTKSTVKTRAISAIPHRLILETCNTADCHSLETKTTSSRLN
ncbi:hypothetical protein B0T14DRAFT_571538 [Immersiella caudata]|uniref:Uncharacterized protein n=1 Tax=Immersiella caudata TaxID=314043 RepID=A0AA39TNL5_9PEZI|nr:hypothetical protein B0T14DRAFT_571538 [Immersiella caudata]